MQSFGTIVEFDDSYTIDIAMMEMIVKNNQLVCLNLSNQNITFGSHRFTKLMLKLTPTIQELTYYKMADTVNPLRYPGDTASTDELVAYYFTSSYTAKEIAGFLLFVHNKFVSVKTVYRMMKRLRLRRYGAENNSTAQTRILSNIGYRAMWKILNSCCGINATQETVRIALKAIHYDGVVARSRRRLVRRRYCNLGPNFCIHIDGYDKLKPFGISVHGAIDGFSRKIIWLTASHTNKNPRNVALNFVEFLRQSKRVPRLVRSDAGTENVIIRSIQIALRAVHNDNMSGYRSFSEGRSTGNQRIEMLWSFLCPYFTTFWRNMFKDMIDNGELNNTNPVHLECVRFCFLPVIQQHLDIFKKYVE
ncbi:Hypothetical predicted protein [Mytilus galloprovincialis]|uniref:Integrase core domain-containing protein n=1 Tax=Mytilus galloprovincialis TaxID=29158 RepID=A0A8B6E1K9_MYTGA|nr:Hypothetical predicted protein [Mytilus galloprovincialis]